MLCFLFSVLSGLNFYIKKSYQNVKEIKNRQVMNKKIFRSSLSEKVGLFNVMMTIYELIFSR